MKKKMKLALHKFIGLMFFSTACTVYAQQGKTIEKSFEVEESTVVDIENTFGVVHISTWEGSTVKVKVEIEARASRDSRLQDMLDNINVEFHEGNYRLEMKTDVDIKTRGDESFSIDYTVQVPAGNKLKVGNSFGDIFIDDRQEEVDVKLAYGDLKAGRLERGGDLRVSFGKGEVDYFAEGNLDLQYCEFFSIEEAGEVAMDQQFSEVELRKVDQVEIDSKYGSLELGEVDIVDAYVRFTDFNIERLGRSIEMDCKYASDFTIDKVLSGFELIDIRGEFGSYNIDLEEGVVSEFKGEFQYADLKTYGVDMDYSLKLREDHRNRYEGKIGDGDSKAKISISSQYGNLRLTQ